MRLRPWVAPYAGAWIEIYYRCKADRKRKVAPYAGAWIEIPIKLLFSSGNIVAPYAGAWIEINQQIVGCIMLRSLPTRERGLKFPFRDYLGTGMGRSLRGSVD